MRKWFILLVLATAVSLAVLASAFGALKASGATASAISTLTVGQVGECSTLDASNGGCLASNFALEGLMQYNAQGALVPDLAKSVSRPGAAVYVYHLRHGVKFWDGHELTAADVANSLNYARYPGAQGAGLLASIKTVTARDRYTVVVTMKHPDPGWEQQSADQGIFEQAFQRAHKATFGQPGTLIMGTGPWEVTSLDPTSGAELSANPHWWGGKVPIAHLSVKFFASETSEALAFRAGAVDWVPGISDVRSFASTAGSVAHVVTYPGHLTIFFAMNSHIAPWQDVHVRRAVAYAVNRSQLANADGGAGLASPATAFLQAQLPAIGTPEQVRALIRSLPSYPYSLAKAKQELAKSAYPHGFTYSIDEPDFYNLPTIAQALAGQLSAIGIKLRVNRVEFGTWLNEISGPGEKRPANVGLLGGALDPSTMAQGLTTKATAVGQYNYADYSNPEVDALVAAGVRTVNNAKRRAIYQKLLTRLAKDLPVVTLLTANVSQAIATKYTLPVLNDAETGQWVALRIKTAK